MSSAPEREEKPPALTGWRALGGDLQDPRWIYLKGILFLFTGCLAGAVLLLENPSWRVAALLCMTVWCCCRFYYFAFYVIEHYVDSEFKFAGLWSFVRYLLRRRSG